MLPDVVHVIHAGGGDLSLIKAGDHLLGCQFREGLDDHGTKRLLLRHAARIRGEALVGRKLRPPEDLLTEEPPLAFVLDAKHHRLAVASRERAVGEDGGVSGARAPRRRCAIEGVVQRVAHPFDHAFQH